MLQRSIIIHNLKHAFGWESLLIVFFTDRTQVLNIVRIVFPVAIYTPVNEFFLLPLSVVLPEKPALTIGF